MIAEPIYASRPRQPLVKAAYGAFEATGHLRGWSPAAFESIANRTDALIIDTRRAGAFKTAFIPNAINMGAEGNFTSWLPALVKDIRQPILLVCDAGREREVASKMARVGFDQCLGYLKGGMQSWLRSGRPADSIGSVDAVELDQVSKKGRSIIIDVRKAGEFALEHLLGAINIPLERIGDRTASLDPHRSYCLYCLNGYRSAIFASMLRSRGFNNLTDVNEGLTGIRRVKGLRSINDLKSMPIL